MFSCLQFIETDRERQILVDTRKAAPFYSKLLNFRGGTRWIWKGLQPFSNLRVKKGIYMETNPYYKMVFVYPPLLLL